MNKEMLYAVLIIFLLPFSTQSGADSVFRVPQDRVLVQEEDSNILLGCIPLLPGVTHFTLLLAPESAPPPDLNFTVDVNQGILIRAVMLNHSGEYVCSGRVNATRQNSPVFVVAVKKKVRLPPAVSVEVDECVRVAGETLQLTCNTNNPDHSFTTRWHHSRKQVLEEEKTRKLVGDTVYLTSVVTLPRLNRSDTGSLTCISTNKVGINTAIVSLRVTEKPYLLLKPLKPSGLNPKLALMEGDTLELMVEIDAYPPIQEGRWSTPKPRNSSLTIETLFTIHRSYRQVASLLIKRIRADERGWYSFHARGADTNNSTQFKVFINQKPVVVINQVNGSLTCVSSGYPPPAVNWLQCEKLHHISVGCDTNRTVVALQSEQYTLQPADEFQPHTVVSVLQTRSNATVECVSVNAVGVGRSTITLPSAHYVSQPPSDRWIFLTAFTGALISATLLILLGFLVYRCKQTPKYEVRWKIIEVSDGNNYSYIDPLQLPYSTKWEFPRDRLTFGQVLGSGAFGKVVEATAIGLEKEDCITQVAVKMLKASAHSEEKEALMCELKILSHLGSHTNIVNLLGACTHGGPVLLITEFCSHGDLLNFLRRKASSFNHSAFHTHETSNVYRNLTEHEDHRRRLEINSYVDMQKGQRSGDYLHVGNSGETQEDFTALTIQHLLKFSSHVAQGLNFLSSKNCIHRDVAARNVLLSDTLVAKICDFGLARDIMNDSNYVVRGNARLPVKWMSPESIFECLYTVQSDVWSYGILLWEIFSLGRNPYPDMVVDARFYKMIKCGYQMSQPDFAPDEMYQIMRMCWSLEPTSRPTFSTMMQMIKGLQDDTTEQQVSAQQLQQYRNLQQELTRMLGSTQCVTDKADQDKTLEEQRPLTHSNNYQLY